jgi:hypothetical protein
MAIRTITLPSNIDLKKALEIGEKLHNLEKGYDYKFDFSCLRFVGPFGMIYLSTCLEDAGKRLRPCKLFAEGHKSNAYLAHMGFYRAFGLQHGNLMGQASGSPRYIPITEIDRLEVSRESAQSGTAIGEIVEERSQQVASVLAQQVEGDLHNTLAYCIREILRNAIEHSQTDKVRFAAQYWPSLDRVEFAVLDHGRGIRAALESNPFVNPRDDREALNLALMPGISGTAFKGTKINRKDFWQNSGFGLYMTNRICRLGGSFFIGSRSSSVFLSSEKKEYFRFHFPGTAIRLSIRPSNVSNLASRLKMFSLEGREIAKKIRGSVVDASAASQMLTVDYRNA